ncbi:BREX-1 system phosphatase PglZ type A [Ligilactobacillus equi]
MAEVSVENIIEKLQIYFERYYYVVWYDDSAAFAEKIDEIAANLAEVHLLKVPLGQSFRQKTYLHEHPDEKILLYFPHPKPRNEENLFLDVEMYAQNYTADADDMLRDELGLSRRWLPFVKKHLTFFNSKERKADFIRFYTEESEVSPELGIVAALEKFPNLKRSNALNLLTPVLLAGMTDNKYLTSFSKYGVAENFWKMVAVEFGYLTAQPDLTEFVRALYLNYAFADLPKEFTKYRLEESSLANVKSYMSNLEDSASNRLDFKRLGDLVWDEMELGKFFKKLSPSTWAEITAFYGIDNLLLKWAKDKLLSGELTAVVGREDLAELLEKRIKLNTLRDNKVMVLQYKMLKYALKLLGSTVRTYANTSEAVDGYVKQDYKLDTYYRKFAFYNRNLVHQMADVKVEYNDLKDYVDQFYADNYLNKTIKSFNESYQPGEMATKAQSNFYREYVGIQQGRIVVIISDAFRFEIAKELQAKLEENRQIRTEMDYALAGLPSVTYMGMATLLPHQNLEFDMDAKKVLVDGQLADNLQKRSQILAANRADGQAAAYALNDVLNASSSERKALFAGKKVVYIYHNDVDAKGDQAKTQEETFAGAKQAIDDIASVIEKLRTISVNHVFVTADHGFIYRDEKLAEMDKIDLNVADGIKSPRYILSKADLPETLGVKKTQIGEALVNNDTTKVYYPTSSNVFKSAGTTSYVHGGSSLQELVVPILEVKMSSNAKVMTPVEIKLAPMSPTITSRDFSINVNQEQAVSDEYEACDYRFYFVDDKDVRISNERTLRADSRADDIRDRAQYVRLQLSNQDYDRQRIYRLIIEQLDEAGNEVSRKELSFHVDLVISGDFGFDI